MIEKRDSFFSKETDVIGICGEFYPDTERFHVGIFWNKNDDKDVVHLLGTNDVRVQPLSTNIFANYYFAGLKDFYLKELPGLMGLADYISENTENSLHFNMDRIIYNGGKFDISNGNFLTGDGTKSMMNCGVFVLALLETFECKTLHWESWPLAQIDSDYLRGWLDYNGISQNEFQKYYNFTKEIRGKHMISVPFADSRPVDYATSETLSKKIINFLKPINSNATSVATENGNELESLVAANDLSAVIVASPNASNEEE